MKISLDKADQKFSQYIRLRDKKCMRCGSLVELNDKGLPISHQASHYWSRRNENTRFESDNVDCLCFYCHSLWGGDYRDEYKEFKIKKLGIERYKSLDVQAHTICKKDRKMSLLKAKALLKSIL